MEEKPESCSSTIPVVLFVFILDTIVINSSLICTLSVCHKILILRRKMAVNELKITVLKHCLTTSCFFCLFNKFLLYLVGDDQM